MIQIQYIIGIITTIVIHNPIIDDYSIIIPLYNPIIIYIIYYTNPQQKADFLQLWSSTSLSIGQALDAKAERRAARAERQKLRQKKAPFLGRSSGDATGNEKW
jgi:hypothetical protein